MTAQSATNKALCLAKCLAHAGIGDMGLVRYHMPEKPNKSASSQRSQATALDANANANAIITDQRSPSVPDTV